MELQKSEERFRKLFEQHSAIKLMIDAKTGHIVDANKAATLYYGWPIEVLKQMSIQEINILPPESVKDEMRKVVLSGNATFEFRQFCWGNGCAHNHISG